MYLISLFLFVSFSQFLINLISLDYTYDYVVQQYDTLEMADLDELELDKDKKNIIVFDDFINVAPRELERTITPFFTLGRHYTSAIFFLTQDYMMTPAPIRNAITHIALFKNAAKSDYKLQALQKAVANDIDFAQFKKLYLYATNEGKHGRGTFLWIDNETDDDEEKYRRLCDNYISREQLVDKHIIVEWTACGETRATNELYVESSPLTRKGMHEKK